MKRLLLAVAALCLLANDASFAFTRLPATGVTSILMRGVRTAPFTVAPNARGFYFMTTDYIDLGAASCGVTPFRWFVVPRFDPSDGSKENPDYREYVDLLLRQEGFFVLYVDGCIGEFPRVVGLNMFQYPSTAAVERNDR